jgi:hypothetical protein
MPIRIKCIMLHTKMKSYSTFPEMELAKAK